jgi:signal transduction histidine kinase/CheY-like chemotaxis protein
MEKRILVLAPLGRDAAIAADLLRHHGYTAEICADMPDLVARMHIAAGMVLITEEALATGDRTSLTQWVQQQPAWSDLPFVVLSAGGSAPRTPAALSRIDDLGNVLILQRPLHAEALLGAVRSALKARLRQYEVRAASETLEKAVIERTRDLEAAKDKLEFALHAASMGSWELDLATGNIERTRRHDEIFGYTSPRAQWSVALLLRHVEARQRGSVAAAFAAAPSTGVVDIECAITGADGSLRWITKKGRARYDETGRAVSISGVVSDITARKEADAQMAQAQKMDAIGQLTGGVAHDFNNLLTPIMGGLDMLQRLHRGDERTQRMVSAAMQAAERAATLTHRLLSFARRQALQPRAVDIGGLIDGIAELIRRSLGPAVDVVLAFQPGLPAALVDPNQLELAVLNLAINARDAMPAGGTLKIAVSAGTEGSRPPELPAGEYVSITVSDTGAGMDKATLARAAEPFFSTKGLGKGTGLGLSMVHGLTAQSGGHLCLASKVGIGTSVEIWLPATQQAAEAASEPPGAGSPAQCRARILLVDDEEVVRSATASMLRDIGHNVTEARSASEALTLLRDAGAFDILVTDYLMPGMNGAGLIVQAQAMGADMPALLITGYAAAGEDVPAGVARLAKPFRQSELAAKVAEQVQLRV